MKIKSILISLLLPLPVFAAVQIVEDGKVLYNCTAATTTPPPVKPPTQGCDPKAERTIPAKVENLPKGGKRRITMKGAPRVEARSFRFNSKNLKNITDITFAAGETHGNVPPSLTNSLSISQCPGDFDYNKLGTKCVSGGRDPSIRISKRSTDSRSSCVLQNNKTYYINVAPIQMTTMKPTCEGACAVVFQGPSLK